MLEVLLIVFYCYGHGKSTAARAGNRRLPRAPAELALGRDRLWKDLRVEGERMTPEQVVWYDGRVAFAAVSFCDIKQALASPRKRVAVFSRQIWKKVAVFSRSAVVALICSIVVDWRGPAQRLTPNTTAQEK